MKGNRIDGGKYRGITGLRMGRDSHSVTGLSGAVHGVCHAGAVDGYLAREPYSLYCYDREEGRIYIC